MNIKEAFNFSKQQLQKAGVEDPAFDTVYFFEYIFSLSRTGITVYADREVTPAEFEKLNECINRRIKNEPVQYILGYWYFMGNRYNISNGVLIPRDDTEVLVNACMKLCDSTKDMRIVDLCSGSGIIAVTLKKAFKNSTVYAVEISDTAYKHLTENCKLNHADVKTIHADLYDCVSDFFDHSLDLIVSNPPYIIKDEIKSLQKEVQFEPTLALDGGDDGYNFYRGIISTYAKKLKSGGYIAFEIGEGQFAYISDLLTQAGFTDITGYPDLSGTTRAVSAVYSL